MVRYSEVFFLSTRSSAEEQWPSNPLVAGSNPAECTRSHWETYPYSMSGAINAFIAQSEEHHFPKVGVTGSSPVECIRLTLLSFYLYIGGVDRLLGEGGSKVKRLVFLLREPAFFFIFSSLLGRVLFV